MFELIIGPNRYSSFQDFQQIPSELPEFSLEAFSFCKAWLEGKEIFQLQTSGSTGSPKLIQILRSQMEASALGTQSYFGITAGTKMLCCMSTKYIAGKMMLVRAMIWKCPLLIIEPSSKPLESLPIDFHPQFVAMVPMQVEESLKSNLKELKSIDHLIIGGAPISQNLKALIIKNQLNSFQTFGMTETVSHIALAPIVESELNYDVLPGVEIGLDDRGALWTKSEMSDNKLIQTNDLVKLISKNSFQWLGRADFVVNSGGVKLHPEILESKIESYLKSYFPNCAFFLFALPDEVLGQQLALFIESFRGDKEKAKKLLEKLKSELNKFETPKGVYLVDKFVRTKTGKINRHQTIDLK